MRLDGNLVKYELELIPAVPEPAVAAFFITSVAGMWAGPTHTKIHGL
jgi:hypothetical protein